MAPRDARLGFQDDILNGNSDAGQDHIPIFIPIFQSLRFFHRNLSGNHLYLALSAEPLAAFKGDLDSLIFSQFEDTLESILPLHHFARFSEFYFQCFSSFIDSR